MNYCVTETMASVRYLLAKWLPVYERALADEPEPGTYRKRVLPRRCFTKEERARVVELLRQGVNPYAIGREMGCCESKVRYYQKFL